MSKDFQTTGLTDPSFFLVPSPVLALLEVSSFVPSLLTGVMMRWVVFPMQMLLALHLGTIFT